MFQNMHSVVLLMACAAKQLVSILYECGVYNIRNDHRLHRLQPSCLVDYRA